MPFAVALIRRLADAGHTVYACDTYADAPGSHSRFVAAHFVTTSPRNEPKRFAEQVGEIAEGTRSSWWCPRGRTSSISRRCRRRAFGCTARRSRRSPGCTTRSASSAWPPSSEPPIPGHPRRPRSDAELRDGNRALPALFARAAFSRGGVAPAHQQRAPGREGRPGGRPPDPDPPWLVQEFLDGPMICTYSTAARGPGDRPLHLPGAPPVGAQHGHPLPRPRPAPPSRGPRDRPSPVQRPLSFDFVDHGGRLYLIECNPRPTDGVLLMSAGSSPRASRPGRRAVRRRPAGRWPARLRRASPSCSRSPQGDARTSTTSCTCRGSDQGWHDLVLTSARSPWPRTSGPATGSASGSSRPWPTTSAGTASRSPA